MALRPWDFEVFETLFDAVMTDQSIPNDTRWAMVSGFWAQARTTPEMYLPFVDDYFDLYAAVLAYGAFYRS